MPMMFDRQSYCRIAASCLFLTLLSVHSAKAIEQQEKPNWCWAACVQDIINEHGMGVSQSDVASELFGWAQDAPATVPQVCFLLNSYNFQVVPAFYPASPMQLYATLQSGWKIIALVDPSGGAEGHFVVLEGIEPHFGGIYVADPATGQTTPVMPAVVYSWHWLQGISVK